MQVRGVSYALDGSPEEAVRRDFEVLRNALHCTTVMLIGSDPGQLTAATGWALDAGLDVYVRPYLADKRRPALLTQLAAVAEGAERLRAKCPGRVTLLLGSEFSLTSPGMIPGPRVFVRLQILIRPRWLRFFRRRINRKLARLLAAGLTVARERFQGPVTYAAGYWEEVDWSGFDLAGVNLYRFGTDPAGYERRLGELVQRAGKRLVITEFGCGSFAGADRRGPGSFLIVNWFAVPPRIKPGHTRDEQTQADYLTSLIDLYGRHGVHGCFVYTFHSPGFPHHEDPAHDLDMAGFGLVATHPDDPTRWIPKQSFHAVARAYDPTPVPDPSTS